MKNLTLLSSYLLLSCLLLSCVDEVDPDIDSISGTLVVDAILTDQKGPHIVKLTRSIGFLEDPFGDLPNVTNARVSITDNQGDIETLEEISPGSYATSENYHAKIGISYILNIELESGERFSSEQEVMFPNPGIDSLIITSASREQRNDNNVFLTVNGIDIRVRSNETTDTSFFRWRYSTTHEIRTRPEEKTTPGLDGIPIPNPPPCSGFVLINGSPTPVDECSCCTCWITINSPRANVSDRLQSNLVYDQQLDFIEDQPGKFTTRFYIKVDQLSLSREAHFFWSQIKNQQEQGSLFDQPTGKIRSNIFSLAETPSPVLGYFSVSSQKTVERFLTPLFFDFPIKIIANKSVECTAFDDTTNERPSFW